MQSIAPFSRRIDAPESRWREAAREGVLAPLACPFTHKFGTQEKKAL
jgi:hypothetical protein